jgi:hypothetical protein
MWPLILGAFIAGFFVGATSVVLFAAMVWRPQPGGWF